MTAALSYNLCAARWVYYALDAVVLLVLFGYIMACAKRGFVNCFFGFVSTTVALVVAVSLAKVCLEISGGLFGLQGLLEGKFTEVFAAKEGFNEVLSEDSLQSAFEGRNLPVIFASVAVKWLGTGTLPADTTLAMVLGGLCAWLLCLLLVGIVIFLLCKAFLLSLRRLLNNIVRDLVILDAANAVLGAGIGLINGMLVIGVLVTVMSVIPISAVSEYLSGSLLLQWVYNHNPLVMILGWFL